MGKLVLRKQKKNNEKVYTIKPQDYFITNKKK